MNIEILLDRVDFLYHKALNESNWYAVDTLSEVIKVLVDKITAD